MRPSSNIFTASFGTAYTTCHYQPNIQTLLSLGSSKLVNFKFIPTYIFSLLPVERKLDFAAS